MQIMIYLDNMPSLLSIQLYHLLVILARILLTLDQFTPHPLILVAVFQKLPTLTIIGRAQLYLVNYQAPMLFLPWTFITPVGIIIPLHSLQTAIILVGLTKHQSHLWLKDLLGQVRRYQDQDLSCIHFLLVTGMPLLKFEDGFRLLLTFKLLFHMCFINCLSFMHY